MIKIALLGILAAILAAWMKTIKSDYSIWIIFGAGTMMALGVGERLAVIVEGLQSVASYFAAYGSYMKLLVKIIGITYLSEISADLCRDAGAATLASQVELFGKLSILMLCIPVMTSLLETMEWLFGG